MSFTTKNTPGTRNPYTSNFTLGAAPGESHTVYTLFACYIAMHGRDMKIWHHSQNKYKYKMYRIATPSQKEQDTTKGNMHRKFGEVLTSGFWYIGDIHTVTQRDIQTFSALEVLDDNLQTRCSQTSHTQPTGCKVKYEGNENHVALLVLGSSQALITCWTERRISWSTAACSLGQWFYRETTHDQRLLHRDRRWPSSRQEDQLLPIRIHLSATPQVRVKDK